MFEAIDLEIQRLPKSSAQRLTWRRGIRLLLVALMVFVLLSYAGLPLYMAVYWTHIPRVPVMGYVPSDAGFVYEDVRLTASDGVELAGWYIPSQNGAAVIVLHGASGTRLWAKDHAEMLARHGYGVLMLDARGHGESGGRSLPHGWSGERDLSAALDYLYTRHDIDNGCIGALGLSSGAMMALRGAASLDGIQVVIADGAGFSAPDDVAALPQPNRMLSLPVWWLALYETALFSGESMPEPLIKLVPEIAPRPVLFIASSESLIEREANRSYADALGASAELWRVDAGHISAFGVYPAEYESRVIEFLDEVLLVGNEL